MPRLPMAALESKNSYIYMYPNGFDFLHNVIFASLTFKLKTLCIILYLPIYYSLWSIHFHDVYSPISGILLQQSSSGIRSKDTNSFLHQNWKEAFLTCYT